MHWKNSHTHLLLVLVSTLTAYFASGWEVLTPFTLPFFRHTWVLILLILLCNSYPLKALKKNELSLFLFIFGSLFLLIGSLAGPLVVTLGFLVQLYALYHYQHSTLHAPDIPDVKRVQ